tara:strand:+ start:836 stop:1237 length:402 start_codon:yes stop_codon:yes gene_type:complete
MADTIIFKNHCTPQEKVSFTNSEKWFLDSDCGRRLSGDCESKTATAIGDLVEAKMGASAIYLRCHFLYLKNTSPLGDNTKFIKMSGFSTDYTIKLLPGEAFACDIGPDSGTIGRPQVSGASGATYEYITGDAP